MRKTRVVAPDGREFVIPESKRSEFYEWCDSMLIWHKCEPPFWAIPADENPWQLLPALALVMVGTYLAVTGLSMIF